MLVLGRKSGESIFIGDGIEITIVGIQGNRVRLGIDAPDHVRVLRSELEPQPKEHPSTMSNSSREARGSKVLGGTSAGRRSVA